LQDTETALHIAGAGGFSTVVALLLAVPGININATTEVIALQGWFSQYFQEIGGRASIEPMYCGSDASKCMRDISQRASIEPWYCGLMPASVRGVSHSGDDPDFNATDEVVAHGSWLVAEYFTCTTLEYSFPLQSTVLKY
jgi:hypothetical protein